MLADRRSHFVSPESSPHSPDIADVAASRADLQIVSWLLGAVFLGVIAMLSLPAARGDSAAFGWMPLWLVGMPLASLATLLLVRGIGSRVRTHAAGATSGVRRRPRTHVQARRRRMPAPPQRWPQAA